MATHLQPAGFFAAPWTRQAPSSLRTFARFCPLCLEQSSSRYSHSLLLPLLQVFVQILPSQWYFPCPSYLKVQSPTLPICSPGVFFSKLISLRVLYNFLFIPPIGMKFIEGLDFCLFCSLLFPQCPEQCLAYSGHSNNINWMNTRLHLPNPSASCQSTKTRYSYYKPCNNSGTSQQLGGPLNFIHTCFNQTLVVINWFFSSYEIKI